MIAGNFKSTNDRPAVLALGGGGARGLAHFGAVQAIIDCHFDIERIVGVSVGSLAGAMSALDDSPLHVQRKLLDYLGGDEFAAKQQALFGTDPQTAQVAASLLAGAGAFETCPWSDRLLGHVFRQQSLLAGHVLNDVIAALVPDIDLEDTDIPLSIVAVDLKSGLPVVLESGSLRRAIAASTAVPGFFPPVPWDDMLLCDLGVLDSLPTQVAKSVADADGLVIGVDVGANPERVENCPTALHALLRMDEIGERLFRRSACRHADVLIRPEVGHIPWHDFSHADRLVTAGLTAGHLAIEQHFRHPDPLPRPILPFRVFNPIQWLTGS